MGFKHFNSSGLEKDATKVEKRRNVIKRNILGQFQHLTQSTKLPFNQGYNSLDSSQDHGISVLSLVSWKECAS